MQMLKATPRNLIKAAEIVRKGGLVVYPTDTVYGLGCDPFNTDAVKRLIRVKGTRDKALPILASSLNDAEKVAVLSGQAKKVAEKFWPGSLTLILPKKKHLSSIVTFGLETVGIRVPNHRTALELIRLSGGLLVGTSANKTRQPPPSTATEAKNQLEDEVDLILDGGKTEIRVSSTVIDFTLEEPKVMRVGSVSLEEIMEFLKKHI